MVREQFWMSCHDERDYEFAKNIILPFIKVLSVDDQLPYTGEWTIINSAFLNGLKKTKQYLKLLII